MRRGLHSSLKFNPHIHVIAVDGCFYDDGSFRKAWVHDTLTLEEAFAGEIFKMLLKRGMRDSQVDMMNSWHHSGFHVYRGHQISADDKEGLERLASYIVRCPFAVARMTYKKESAKVLYLGKTTSKTEVYPALDFLARLIIKIPTPGEQMVRYYGYYPNKSRGLRKKMSAPDDGVKEVLPARKLTSISWARLIAKVYLDDPLACPECRGQMKIVAFIEEGDVIAKILKHLGLWERPVAHLPPILEFVELKHAADDCSQLLPVEYEYEAC
jgi:hypothetical protein